MKNKIEKWRKHILMSEKACFRKRDFKVMVEGFKLDLKYELNRGVESDWIEVECRWRNIGYK